MAFSATRRGSRNSGKQVPLRSFGICTSTVPARVSQARARYPFRWFTRSTLRSCEPAPQSWSTSSAISRSATNPNISARTCASGVSTKSARSAAVSDRGVLVMVGLLGQRSVCKPNLSRRTTMAAKRPARTSLRYAKATLSPRYRRKLHQPLGHCSCSAACAFPLPVVHGSSRTKQARNGRRVKPTSWPGRGDPVGTIDRERGVLADTAPSRGRDVGVAAKVFETQFERVLNRPGFTGGDLVGLRRPC